MSEVIGFGRFSVNRRSLVLASACLAIVVGMSFASPFFFAVQNFLNIGRAVALTGIVAAVTTAVLVSGNLDLSIAATTGFAGMTVGWLLLQGISLPVAIFGGLLSGAVIGAINAAVVVRFNVNALIATIGTAFVIRGASFLVNDGRSIFVENTTFISLAQGTWLGIPKPIYYMAVVFVVIAFVMRLTRVGAHIYAVGSSVSAAERAGVKVARVQWGIYLASAIVAALAGVVLSAQAGSAFPYAAQGKELEIIAAVILGGTALTGGRGSVSGTLLGVILLGLMANSLNLLGFGAPFQDITRGAVLVIAIIFDSISTRREGI
jgi:ribose transport system permease protein